MQCRTLNQLAELFPRLGINAEWLRVERVEEEVEVPAIQRAKFHCIPRVRGLEGHAGWPGRTERSCELTSPALRTAPL